MFPSARLLARTVAGALAAAAFLSAAPAQAEISPTVIPASERDAANPNHCAKLEIAYARGTSEPTQNSWALNGYNYGGSNYYGSSRNSPYAIWYQITRDLGNRKLTYTDTNGVLHVDEPEYTMLYPNGRSDFVLYNVTYPADLSFLTTFSSSNSIQRGTYNLMEHLNIEAARCPDKKYMLFGYSQGALVVANTVSQLSQQKYIYPGGTNPLPLLSDNARTHIVSVGMLADAGFNSHEKLSIYNPQTGTSRLEYNRGLYSGPPITEITPWNLDANTPTYSNGRRNVASGPLTNDPVRGAIETAPAGPPNPGLRADNWTLPGLEDRVRNYCVLTDPICNRSATDAGEHLNYFNNALPRRDLQVFAVRKLREADPRWDTQQANLPSYATAFPTYGAPDNTLLP